MFKNMFHNLHKKAIIFPIFLLAFYVSSAKKPDHSADYDCLKNSISKTSQFDNDSNGVYDTYGISICDADTIQPLPLKALGKMDKWPPNGGPTHSIVFENNGTSPALLETFYNSDGTIYAWFQKSGDNDTVFYHENDTYTPPNFCFDSSAYYIQMTPNPAKDFLNIHYVVKQAGTLQIQLLSYEGNLIATLVNTFAGQGDYRMFYDSHNLDDGYYLIRYSIGMKSYTITIAIVR